MSAAGAGSKITVQLPSPLSVATGPPAGSQPQKGPVIRTSAGVVTAEQDMSSVANKGSGPHASH